MPAITILSHKGFELEQAMMFPNKICLSKCIPLLENEGPALLNKFLSCCISQLCRSSLSEIIFSSEHPLCKLEVGKRMFTDEDDCKLEVVVGDLNFNAMLMRKNQLQYCYKEWKNCFEKQSLLTTCNYCRRKDIMGVVLTEKQDELPKEYIVIFLYIDEAIFLIWERWVQLCWEINWRWWTR